MALLTAGRAVRSGFGPGERLLSGTCIGSSCLQNVVVLGLCVLESHKGLMSLRVVLLGVHVLVIELDVVHGVLIVRNVLELRA